MTNLFAQDFYDNALNQKLTGYIVELITDKAFLYLWRWSLISNRYWLFYIILYDGTTSLTTGAVTT
ncbi:hypothetical protein E0J32_23330 [Escherichia coli]|nr:hypothetical protein A5956_24120 [Escherichia coli]QCH48947.1 hypothetical protein C8202_26515 [Escherichia coli O113:H21]EFC9647764.1 hypothetical protein [Escherichia coli]EFI3577278.1 hypothetical protein [Escherichia coli]EFJ0498123.1 hypothetical protein [Escherichia coli]